jgi:hypothetical protein
LKLWKSGARLAPGSEKGKAIQPAWVLLYAHINASHVRPEELMDGLATTQLKGIVAPINFTAPLSEKPSDPTY